MPVVAAGQAAPDSLTGHWGPVPARSDSTVHSFGDRSLPVWEYPIHGAYTLISLPIEGLQWLTAKTVKGLDDLGAFRPVDPLLRGVAGPFGTRILPNFRLGGLAGFGGGLNVHHRQVGGSTDNRFLLRWQATTRRATRVTAGLRFGLDPRDDIQFGGGYRKRPNARWFGVGPATPDSDQSYFTQEASWAGAQLTRPLAGNLSWRLTGGYSWVDNRGPRPDESPALEDRHASGLPFGWGARSDGISLGLGLVHDDTRTDGRPVGGGVRRLKAARFLGRGDLDADFWTFRAEAEQFLPLWHTHRGLALRGLLSWIEADGPVHFQRLITNDDPDLLRGFRDFRFADRGLLALTAEYRWPVLAWSDTAAQGIDAYLFADFGQVFGEREEIALDRLTDSYGFGLRILGGDGEFSARFEVAFSDEETVIRFRSDQIFQFAKRGVFHGRVPIPER